MSNLSTNTAPRVALPDAALPAVLREWKEISTWVDTAKKKEMELRQQICAAFFPKPVEGINRVITMLDGNEIEIAVDHCINRKLDEAVLDSVMLSLPEDSPYRQPGVLVAFKPSLVLKGFRTLPDDQRRIFSAALTETPGSPSLEIEGLVEANAPAPVQVVDVAPSRVALAEFRGDIRKTKPKKLSAADRAVAAVNASKKKR